MGYADGLVEYKEILEFEYEDEDDTDDNEIDEETDDDEATEASVPDDEQVIPIEDENEQENEEENDVLERPLEEIEDFDEELELRDESEREDEEINQQGYSVNDTSEEEDSDDDREQEKSQYWETPTAGPRRTRNTAPKYRSYRHQAVQFLMESEAKRKQKENAMDADKELYKNGRELFVCTS